MNIMKNLNGIDSLKFIMAIIIIGVHSCIFEELGNGYWEMIVKNITYLCVPTFFVISSFFFFKKIRMLNSIAEKKKQLWHFEKRLMLLYTFWIVVQLPYVIYVQKYHELSDIIRFLRDIFFGSTFIASWFMGAMITGMPIVFMLSKNRFSKVLVTGLLCVVYMFVCQDISWGGWLIGIERMLQVLNYHF